MGWQLKIKEQCRFQNLFFSHRVEYVRLVGANELGGHAEMAISKSKEFRGGCETPSSEPGMDLLDLWDLEDEVDPNVFGDHEPNGVQHAPNGPQVGI